MGVEEAGSLASVANIITDGRSIGVALLAYRFKWLLYPLSKV